MGFFSLFLFGFSAWTYGQSIYTEKIKKSFAQITATEINNLKDVSLLSTKTVLVTGNIISDQSFLSRDKQKVVLERYKEESQTSKGWKDINDSFSFKVVPFKIKNDKAQEVFIDPYGLDKTYIGEPERKIENGIRKSLWKLKLGQKINVLGNVDNNAGSLVINDPNLKKSFVETIFDKEPFIITSMEKSQTAVKAEELYKSIYFSSLALLAVGIFFIFSSITNVLKQYKKTKETF
ncbi:hypothetical protein EON78_06665 [bacterium]|nr:MAG: hypothetical protein EON78_06665 [bacterium]